MLEAELHANNKVQTIYHDLTRATLSVALYGRQMQLHGITFTTWK